MTGGGTSPTRMNPDIFAPQARLYRAFHRINWSSCRDAAESAIYTPVIRLCTYALGGGCACSDAARHIRQLYMSFFLRCACDGSYAMHRNNMCWNLRSQ